MNTLAKTLLPALAGAVLCAALPALAQQHGAGESLGDHFEPGGTVLRCSVSSAQV